MRISDQLRVGTMFLVGLALLVLLIVTLTRWGQDRHAYAFTIRFAQAQGLQKGAAVRVAGVEVGRVSDVALEPGTNEALITARVDERVHLYRNYLYTIGIGGLVGERFIDIRPTNDPGPRVEADGKVTGSTMPDFNDLMASADVLVTQLTQATSSLNKIIGDDASQQNLKQALVNLQTASKNSVILTENLNHLVGDNRQSMNETFASARTASRNAVAFTEGLNGLLATNQQSIGAIVTNLQDVSSDLRTVSDTLSPQLRDSNIISNLEQASKNTIVLTERLQNIAGTVDALMSDKELSANLKESVVHLRQASIDLEAMMKDAQDAVGAFPKVTASLQRASDDLPEITRPFREVAPETAENIRQLSLRLRTTGEQISGVAGQVARAGQAFHGVRFQPEARVMMLPSDGEHNRSDLNLDVQGPSAMLRLGIADIGNSSKLNLQVGNQLENRTWLRYGLVQSRFGLGVDYDPMSNLRLTGEVFDPNQLRANALLNYRLGVLGEDWWLTTGWYDLFDNSRFGLGLTYRE